MLSFSLRFREISHARPHWAPPCVHPPPILKTEAQKLFWIYVMILLLLAHTLSLCPLLLLPGCDDWDGGVVVVVVSGDALHPERRGQEATTAISGFDETRLDLA